MLALLKFFIIILLLVLVLSAVFGIIAFFKDLHDFKAEKNLSLPRKKLIQALALEEIQKDLRDNIEKDGEPHD